MKGLLWVFFEKVGVTILSLVATFWYANLLGPIGFGLSLIILSASLFVSTIIENLQQYPLIAARKDIDEVFKTSAIGWAFISTLVALVLYVILISIYGSDWWLLILLSVSYIPISSISRVYIADLIIKQNYKQLAYRACWGKALGVMSGLLTAYMGYVELAIILQSFVAVCVSFLVMAYSNMNLINLKSRFNFKLFKNLIMEGIPSGVAIIEQNAKSHGLIVFLGVFAGPHISGLYALAVRFVDIPRTLIGLGFTTWATGKFHGVRNEQKKLLRVFSTALLCCSSVLVPCYVGLMAVSGGLVIEFFGREWSGASDIIFWLALYHCIVSLFIYLPPLQDLFKTTYKTLWVNVSSTILIFLVIAFFSGTLGVYAPIVGMYTSLIFVLPKYSVEMAKLLHVSFLSIVNIVFGTLLAAIVMYMALYIWQNSFYMDNLYGLILIGLLSYLIIYAICILANLIDKKVLANIKDL